MKTGKLYECVIAPKGKTTPMEFNVIVKLPGQDTYIPFNLFATEDGHWVPSNTTSIDPWMADAVGRIIMNNY